MAINRDKPDLWKKDIAQSVDMYNHWFMNFAPVAFREIRIETTKNVVEALKITGNLANIQPAILKTRPQILPTLRMSTCPPLAVDRLIGLAGVPANLIKRMERQDEIPVRMNSHEADKALQKVATVIEKMLDRDIFPWIAYSSNPEKDDIHRAATIVADRLCGSITNPLIRNAQEKRQLDSIGNWLKNRGYRFISNKDAVKFNEMPAGTFTFHKTVPVELESGKTAVNISIDIIIKPKEASDAQFPILIEAKSAGDFANVNKRRKEEGMKMTQLRKTYGKQISYNLLLCGYFDSSYLGYEAAEGIDWIWEHRIDDLTSLGV